MNEPLVTTDSILSYLRDQIEQKQPIDPSTWLRAAQQLNILLQDESSKLFAYEQECSKMKSELITGGKPVSAAKVVIEASNEYRGAREQKAKIDRIVEMIRLAKLQARISSDEMKGY